MSTISCQQRSVSGPTAFPLSKFSFATVSGELTRPIPWTHISDKGHLFAVFEHVSLPSCNGDMVEKHQFRILADPEILEDVDLRALASEAIKATEELKTLPTPPKFPTVTIIIQEPCIAVRFPLPYGQIRRFQIKFKLQSDFYKALALFSEVGCPITQAGSIATPIHGGRPKTNSSSTAADCPSSRSQEIPQQAQRVSEPANTIGSINASKSSSSRPSTISEGTARSEKRPLSCSSSSSGTTRALRSSGNSQRSPCFLGTNHPGLATGISVKQCLEPNATLVKGPQNRRFLPPSNVPELVSTLNSTEDNSTLSEMRHQSHRSSTALACEPETLSHMLPPRRELPFKVPKATSGKGGNGGRADSHARQQTGAHRNAAGRNTRSTELPAKGMTPESADPSETAHFRGRAEVTASHKPLEPQPNGRVSSALEDTALVAQGVEEDGAHAVEEATRVGTVIHRPSRIDACIGSNAQKPRTTIHTATETSEDHSIECSHRKRGSQDLLVRVNEGEQQIRKRKGSDTQASCLPSVKRVDREDRLNSATSLEGCIYAMPSRAESGIAVPSSQGCHNNPAGTFRARTEATNDDDQFDNHTIERAPQPAKRRPNEVPGVSIEEESARLPLADVSNLAQPLRGAHVANSPIMGLMADPAFAKIPRTAKWADLPSDEREAALETWICGQLESDDFATLVKDLEGMWQRIFLGV